MSRKINIDQNWLGEFEATLDGWEPDEPVGRGKTEAEARDELAQLLEEADNELCGVCNGSGEGFFGPRCLTCGGGGTMGSIRKRAERAEARAELRAAAWEADR